MARVAESDRVRREAAVLRDPTIASGIGQFAAVQAAAPSLGMELSAVDVRDAGEIERAVISFTRSPNGGLIGTAGARWRRVIATCSLRSRPGFDCPLSTPTATSSPVVASFPMGLIILTSTAARPAR